MLECASAHPETATLGIHTSHVLTEYAGRKGRGCVCESPPGLSAWELALVQPGLAMRAVWRFDVTAAHRSSATVPARAVVAR